MVATVATSPEGDQVEEVYEMAAAQEELVRRMIWRRMAASPVEAVLSTMMTTRMGAAAYYSAISNGNVLDGGNRMRRER